MFNDQLKKLLIEKYGATADSLLEKLGNAKALMPLIPGAGATHAIAGSILDAQRRGLEEQDAPAPTPEQMPVPPTPPAPMPVVQAPVAPVAKAPAMPAPQPQSPVSAPIPAPMEQMPSDGRYNNAARQQLYDALASSRKEGSSWAAVAGLGDMARRMGGGQGIDAQKALQEQVNLEEKTGMERFEAGRKGSREEIADYLKQKQDARDFGFKEKEAGLKHEEIKAAREANMLLKSQMAADKAAKTKEGNDMKLDKMIQHHTDHLSKEQIPQLLNAYNELAPQFASGKDVAGIGALDSWVPGAFLSDKGQGNRERLQQMANVFLKLRSGAAVTDPEYRRFLNESAAGQVPTERAYRQWMRHMGTDMKMAMGLAESGLPPEALAEYKMRPDAVSQEDMYGYKAPAPAQPQQVAPQAAPSGDAAARKARIAELRAKRDAGTLR